jgi:hypothetical protein
MNAPLFPPNPFPGEVFCGFTWNGSQWICTSGGQAVVQQVFSTAGGGVYMPSPGLVSCLVECVGGGGGGGGAQGELDGPPATINGWMLSGGGGSSGNYARSVLSQALVRGGVNLTIGAGGAAGAPTFDAVAGPGGSTSFGALVVALGGLGGSAGVWNGTTLSVGSGGSRNGGVPIGGTGQFLAYGNGGEHGQVIMYDSGVGQVFLWGGRGGASQFASAEVGSLQSPAGSVGGNGFFGAGGGGGSSPYASGPAFGGSGGAGVIIVTEYCLGFGDGASGDCGCGQARVAIGSQGWRARGPEGGWDD